MPMTGIPLAAPPIAGRCTCEVPEPEAEEIIWPENPNTRTRSFYVARRWCARCDGWITARDVWEDEVKALPEPARLAIQYALAAAWTQAHINRSRGQKRRRRSGR